MEFHSITDNVYYFQGSVNIGYVRFSSGEGMLIDAGLEEQAMKKVLKTLKIKELPLTHLFITHAHADHYGGAAYLQRHQKVYTMAPKLEAAILQEPILEPLYLFHGVNPIQEWRNKFLEGKPIKVDLILEDTGEVKVGESHFQTVDLPGHSYHQFGVIVEDVLFAADAYFGVEIIHKHGIPYIVDAKQTIESLEKIKNLPCAGAIPGHGSYEVNFLATIEENLQVHQEIENLLYTLVNQEVDGITIEQLVTKSCMEKGITIRNVPSFMLFRTAVTAYLTKLIQEGRVELIVCNNQLVVASSSE
ncbi:MBL fold metallo-hydrolase [Sutcliffiella horikoshii]|uniref:MBL fold metallo-hydrolase n=1 Tax=Sutcliffiella horikoshii TaxID=79883 RepID=A0A5D4SU91_9BACI|nr:MBL fold metallo-hydrolase [Sutcliffiella horikoshii]TYS65762.1 MBL fold metallo-hydrolase [Sutcliffiella horikoshii]